MVGLSKIRFALTAAFAAGVSPKDVALADRIFGTYFGAVVADAFTLGSHYEYDAPTILKAYGGKSIDRFYGPGEAMGGTTHGVGWGRRNYHPGQKTGDCTDYGEYNIMMLQYLAEKHEGVGGAVDMKKLLPFWKKRMTDGSWGAWQCTQTKQALQTVQRMDLAKVTDAQVKSLGGHSNAMGLRSAAVFGVWEDEEGAAKASRSMMFTHASEDAQVGGEFFTRVVHKILYEEMTPREAIEAVAKKSSKFAKEQVKKGIAKYEEVIDETKPLGKQANVDDLAVTSMARLWDVGKSEPIKVGKASPTEGTMPSSIYFILKYQDDFIAGLKANTMVGGDNASRSIAVGMVLGAWHGVNAVPADLKATLNTWKKSEAWLKKLPIVRRLQADSKNSEL